MKTMRISKIGVVGVAVAVVAAVLLVACGGGGRDSTTADGRKQTQGAGVGSAIAWTPVAITDTANPGSRQDIPVTFTSSADLANVVVTVVPALRALVTISPSSFATLQKGQTATVTLTVAPSTIESLRVVEGTIRFVIGTSTIAKPLPVKISLVAPEVINGITVPPEPPPELNDATLAGFDANGNGVRDDVERLIAARFGGNSIKYQEMITFATAEQALIVTQSEASIAFYTKLTSCTIKRSAVSVDELNGSTRALLNTRARNNAYGMALAGAIGEGCK